MSGEKTPMLSQAIPAFEKFLARWEQLAEKNPQLRPFIEEGLTWATEYYKKMDRTHSYIISMGM
jgi:hypothetical protein